MTDFRLVSVADLSGVTVDLALLPQTQHLTTRSGPNNLGWFGTRFFGSRFFGSNFFGPQWVKTVFVAETHGLDETHELETAALVALGTDSLSDVDEVLPDPDSTDRRGWWGDLEAQEIWGGWPVGCKNWLLARAKISDGQSLEGNTVERARIYTLQALQPFVDHRVISSVTVNAKRVGLDRIIVTAIMHRQPEPEISLRFQVLWDEIKVL